MDLPVDSAQSLDTVFSDIVSIISNGMVSSFCVDKDCLLLLLQDSNNSKEVNDKIAFFILNNFSWLLKQETQTFAIRHTVHHKPQMYMGNLRPMGAAPITFVLLVFLRW